jgi:limonene-1,2-epoxide hydrolase
VTVAEEFLLAMSDGDGDAVERLVDPQVVLVLGPHEVEGVAQLRRMAEEVAPLEMRIEPETVEEAAGTARVHGRRVQRWRDTGEIASEDAVDVACSYGEDGRIVRVELRTGA